MEKIEISLETLNAIVGYLGRQPFQEVAPLINAIELETTAFRQQINEAREKEEEKAATTKGKRPKNKKKNKK